MQTTSLVILTACARNRSLLLVLMLAIVVTGCGGGETEPSAEAVGDMYDLSFDRARGMASGVNAEGREVAVADFEGGFLWVEHTAEWCPPCRAQAPILKRVADDYPDVTFLVLLTATNDAFQAPTRSTAKKWAKSHGLDPELVVAKYRNDTRAIPQHRLFSPDGQLLFYAKGQLARQTVETVLDERIPDWEAWDEGGEEATWMK